MRHAVTIGVLTCLAALACGVANAQGPAQRENPPRRGGQPIQDAALNGKPGILDERIDILLRKWSVHTQEIKSLYTEFSRTSVDVTWDITETVKGSARYLAPDRARFDIEEGESRQSFVLNGKGELWEFKPPTRQVIVHLLPQEANKQDGIQDGPLQFLFGTKPEKAKARYHIKLLAENDKVIHLEILPKLQQDLQDFTKAQLWLDPKQFLPQKIEFEEPNKNRVTFDFKGIWINIEIDATNFDAEMFWRKHLMRWELIDKRKDRGGIQAPRSTR